MTKPTPKQILEILGTDPRYVSRDQLRGLTRDQLRGLTRDQLSWLTRDQLSWLTRDQLSWLTGDQLSWLTRDQLSWLTREQLSWLTRDQLSWLTREQQDFIGLKNVPVLDRPYTQILKAVKDGKNLEMKVWHTCETTHCVGGWTVHLTPGGKELEAKYDTRLAAELILRASRPDAPLPNFTASNEAAMAFIEARAAEESKC